MGNSDYIISTPHKKSRYAPQFVLKNEKWTSSKLPDAPFDSCFYILDSNFDPTPEYYRVAFLIDTDAIDHTAPQFFTELRLFFGQIFQLGYEIRKYFLRVILLLDEILQFLKSAMLFDIY